MRSSGMKAQLPSIPTPSSPAIWQDSGLLTVCHSGGGGPWVGLGGEARGGRTAGGGSPLSVVPGPDARHDVQRLAQLRLRRVAVDAEGLPLRAARAREAELEPPVREHVDERRALGDAHGMVDAVRREDPRGAEPDAPGVAGD